jgi:TonB family protein
MSGSIWLNDLAAYWFQVVVLVGTAALLARVLPLGSPAARLAYWRALLVICLLLPVLQPWHRPAGESGPVLSAVLTPAAVPPEQGAAPPAPADSRWRVLQSPVVWLAAGTALRMAWLALGLFGLRRLRRRASPLPRALSGLAEAEVRTGACADLFTSDRVPGPITFGLRRAIIILPASVVAMEARLRETILCHELLHVRRRDWIHEVIEECIRAALWFHPAVLWLIGRIRLSREQVVDEAVIELTSSREQYVEALVAVASARMRAAFVPATPFLRRSLLKERVGQIWRDTHMTKRRLIGSLAACSSVLLLTTAGAVRLFPLQASGPEPKELFSVQLLDGETPQVLRGGENLLHGGAAEYPRRALETRIEGDVVLDVTVDPQGMVSDARVLSGPQELRRAALESVLRWHYSPGTGPTQVVLGFRLPEEKNIELREVHVFRGEEAKLKAEHEHAAKWKAEALIVGEKIAGNEVELHLKREAERESGTWELRERDARLPQKLTRIRTERIPDSVLGTLTDRMGLHVGDVVTEEMLKRAHHAIREFDEHFRVSYHGDGEGGVEIVVLAP